MQDDQSGIEVVQSKVPQSTTHDGDVRRKLFLALPNEEHGKQCTIGPMRVDLKKLSELPKPITTSRLLKPPHSQASSSKGPQKLTCRDMIVKLLTPKKGV